MKKGAFCSFLFFYLIASTIAVQQNLLNNKNVERAINVLNEKANNNGIDNPYNATIVNNTIYSDELNNDNQEQNQNMSTSQNNNVNNDTINVNIQTPNKDIDIKTNKPVIINSTNNASNDIINPPSVISPRNINNKPSPSRPRPTKKIGILKGFTNKDDIELKNAAKIIIRIIKERASRNGITLDFQTLINAFIASSQSFKNGSIDVYNDDSWESAINEIMLESRNEFIKNNNTPSINC